MIVSDIVVKPCKLRLYFVSSLVLSLEFANEIFERMPNLSRRVARHHLHSQQLPATTY